MLVKDIIKLACNFTENEDLASKIENNSQLSETEGLIKDSLVNCFNLINNEIASEYLPYLKSETFIPTAFKVSFDDFSKDLIEIISVKDKNGRNLKYKKFDSYIVVFAKEVEIVYSYKPDNMTLSSSFDSLLPERVFAYGVAREFYFTQTLFDDADIWESRFKNSLQVLVRKKSEVKIPSRRWI